jgi:hypothetical protein
MDFKKIIDQLAMAMKWLVDFTKAGIESFIFGRLSDKYRGKYTGSRFNLSTNGLLLFTSLFVSIYSANIAKAIKYIMYYKKDNILSQNIDSSDFYCLIIIIVLSVLWVLCFVLRETSIRMDAKQEQYELKMAFLRLPPGFSQEKARDMYIEARAEIKTRQDCTEKIKYILSVIHELSSMFSSKNKDDLGVNIMIAYNQNDPRYDELKSICKITTGDVVHGTGSYLEVIPHEIKSKNDTSRGNGNRFVLYAPSDNVEITTREGRFFKVMMGAPFTFVFGEPTLYRNTQTLISFCADNCSFSRESIHNLEEYFLNDGKNIRSFACFRIGNSGTPIGVLNIDSSEPDVLGSVDAFLPTFNFLIEPFLAEIEHLLIEYKKSVNEPT